MSMLAGGERDEFGHVGLLRTTVQALPYLTELSPGDRIIMYEYFVLRVHYSNSGTHLHVTPFRNSIEMHSQKSMYDIKWDSL